MKKLSMVVVMVGMVALASCGGGSGGSSSAQDAINNSATAFGDIVDSIFDNPDACTTKATLECPCPTSGTVDMNTDTYVLTFNSCVSNGLTFDGSMQTDDTGSSITVDMSQFGECTNVTGTVTGADVENCSGGLSGTCAGESISCTMASDCDTCDI